MSEPAATTHLESGLDSPKLARVTLLSAVQKLNVLIGSMDKLIGEAANQTEEDALFAAGYRFVFRTDLVGTYVPGTTSSGTTSSGTTTTTTAAGTTSANTAPTSTIIFSNIT